MKSTRLFFLFLVATALCFPESAEIRTGGKNPHSTFKTFPQEKNFFPIGVWLQQPKDAGEYKQLGINFYYGLWQGPTEEQISTLKKHGMGVICHYNDYARAQLRNEPAVWGWMHPDEPDLAIAYPRKLLKGPGGKEIIRKHWPEIYEELDLDHNEYNGWGMGLHPVNDIQAAYKVLKEEDPDRPVFLQLSKAVSFEGRGKGRGDRNGKTWEYPLYFEGADAVSFDNYPVAYGAADQLWQIPDGVRQLKKWGSGDRPLMVVLEAGFGETWATEHQQRAQVWMAINHGASGICWFVHRWVEVDGKRTMHSERMPLTNPEVGRAVRKINTEIHELASVINSPPATAALNTEGLSLDISTRVVENTLYIFAVENKGQGGEAVLTLPDLKQRNREITVLFEDRKHTLKQGRFTDRFEAWDVNLYKLPLE